jgi:hypothetical protein
VKRLARLAVAGLVLWKAADLARRFEILEAEQTILNDMFDAIDYDGMQEWSVKINERLAALEARPSIEDALTRFSQRYLAEQVRQRRQQGEPGPQG